MKLWNNMKNKSKKAVFYVNKGVDIIKNTTLVLGMCMFLPCPAFAGVLSLDKHVLSIGDTLNVRWAGMASLNNGVMLNSGKVFIMYANTALPGAGSQDLTFYSDWEVQGILYFRVESKANTSFYSDSEPFFVGFPVQTPKISAPKNGAVFTEGDTVDVSFSGVTDSDLYTVVVFKGVNANGSVVFEEESHGSSSVDSAGLLSPGTYYVAVRATKAFPTGFGISRGEFDTVFPAKISGSSITIKQSETPENPDVEPPVGEDTDTGNDETPGEPPSLLHSLPFSEDFEDDISMLFQSIGSSSTFVIDPSGGVDGSACARITGNGSSSTPLWMEVLYLAGINMGSLSEKTLEFDVKGSSLNMGRSIEVISERGTAPYTFQGLWGSVVLTEQFQHVRFDFTPNFIDPAADINVKIRFGGVPGRIYIDNILLKDKTNEIDDTPSNDTEIDDHDQTGTDDDIDNEGEETEETTETTPIIEQLKQEAGCFINTTLF